MKKLRFWLAVALVIVPNMICWPFCKTCPNWLWRYSQWVSRITGIKITQREKTTG